MLAALRDALGGQGDPKNYDTLRFKKGESLLPPSCPPPMRGLSSLLANLPPPGDGRASRRREGIFLGEKPPCEQSIETSTVS